MGNLYIIAAPSGTGKTTLVEALTEALPNIMVSISHTTREKRPAEIDGVNYYFIDEETFKKSIQADEFLEHALIYKHYYGTSKKWVESTLAQGIDVILEIDWQGQQQIKKIFPQAISIFLIPPTIKCLRQRLNLRNQDKDHVIKTRLKDVSETVSHLVEFDFVVVNDDFDHALADLKTIVLAGRLQTQQQINKHKKLIDDLMHLNEQ